VILFFHSYLLKMTKIIGITGGKGGTGKSTIATALAYELAKDKRILLVDMDADCPNDHLILGIKRELVDSVYQRIPKWNLDKCIKCGACGKVCETNAIVSIKGSNPIFMPLQCNGCGACFLSCPVNATSWDRKEVGYIFSGFKHNIDLLSGELKVSEPIAEIVVNNLKKTIEKKKEDYDYIIIDTAAGTKCDVIVALEICESVFPVTEPTPLGAHDLELILKLLSRLEKKVDIILNRSDIGNQEVIEKLSKQYKSNILAEIPYSKKILKNYSKGIPIEIESIKKVIEDIK